MSDGEELIRDVWKRWNSGVREYQADVLDPEIEERSANQLVVRGTIRARGRQSRIDLDQAVTWTVDLRDGRMLRLVNTLGMDAGSE